MPTSRSSSTARLRACARVIGMCWRMVSASCAPMVKSGFSEVSGSWKIAPISRPRTASISRSESRSMRRPSSRISPPAIRPGRSSRPRMASPVIDLPAPDSPTTPRISPGRIVSDTSSSAVTDPCRPENSTTRLRTSRQVPAIMALPSRGSWGGRSRPPAGGPRCGPGIARPAGRTAPAPGRARRACRCPPPRRRASTACRRRRRRG